MDAHAAAFGTSRALRLQRALGTDVFGKVHNATRHKGHFLVSRTANHLPVLIKDKRLLGKAFSCANRPGFAIKFQLTTPLAHQMATQIRAIDMQFFQHHRLLLQVRDFRLWLHTHDDVGQHHVAGQVQSYPTERVF